MRFQRRQARQWSWSPQGALWGLGLWEQEARGPDCWGWRRGKAGRGWAGMQCAEHQERLREWGNQAGGRGSAAQTTLPRGILIWRVLGSSLEVSGTSVKRNAWMSQVLEVPQHRLICKESGSRHLLSKPQCFQCHAPSQS